MLKYFDTLVFFTNGDFHSAAYSSNVFLAKIFFFFIIQSLVFAIGYFSGYEIPLLIKIQSLISKDKASEEHRVLAFSYLGTLIGTLGFAYYFLPKLDVLKTSVVVSGINLFVCIYIYVKFVQQKEVKYFTSMLLVGSIILSIAIFEKNITQRYLKFFYYHQHLFSKLNVDFEDGLKHLDHFEPIERTKSDYQYIDIMRIYILNDIPDSHPMMMALDHRFQFSTNGEIYYHQAFAHIPMALQGSDVSEVLVLGGGDGFLIRELLKYKKIKKIKIIELDKKIVDLANSRFAYLNKNAFLDPRVELEINDAFYVLRNTNKKYDAIFIDFPHPNNYDLSKLFSIEFYKYVANALNTNGFVAFDAPLYNKTDGRKGEGSLDLISYFNEKHFEANSILASTVFFAGFKTIFPYIINKESFMFMKKEPGAIEYKNLDKIDRSLLLPDIAKEVEEIKSYNFPYEIAPKFINSIFKPVLSRAEDP
jgi:spermidine synthase